MQKLSNAAAGRYMIKWIFVEPELRKVLSSICIDKGKIVTVVKRNPLGGILLKSEAGSFFIDSAIPVFHILNTPPVHRAKQQVPYAAVIGYNGEKRANHRGTEVRWDDKSILR